MQTRSPDFKMSDFGADRGDEAGSLVAEHHRRVDDEISNSSMFVVVDVASTDANRLDGDPDFVVRRLQDRQELLYREDEYRLRSQGRPP